jgi:hypothetical protein
VTPNHAPKPLLIALTAPIGGGKSRALSALREALAPSKKLAGFIAHAHGREASDRGAARYDLELIGGQTLPYALRDERLAPPPYRFDPATDAAIDGYLADHASVEVLLLDEFGPREVAGEGHVKRWPALLALGPRAIVIALRHDVIEAIERALGSPFDHVLDADAPDLITRVERLLAARADFERIGWFGAAGGALEVGAGSIVHGLNLPLGGLGMVATQCVLLTQAGEGLERPARVAWVAQIAAGLKALSPAGQRIRPMVAIAMQGWLYALAIQLLGWRWPAVLLGGALMGAWAGAQGILLQWLLIGADYAIALEKIVNEVNRWFDTRALTVMRVVTLYIGVHALGVAAAAIVAWRWRWRQPDFERLRTLSLAPAAPTGRAWLGALRDVARPSFWLPLAIILGALALAGHSTERLLWIGLRALAIGWLLFALLRRLPLDRLGDWLTRRGLHGPAHAWARSLTLLNIARRPRA